MKILASLRGYFQTAVIAITILLAIASARPAWAESLSYSGLILDDKRVPLEGSAVVEFRFFNSNDVNAAAMFAISKNIALQGGRFNVELPLTSGQLDAMQKATHVYIQVAVTNGPDGFTNEYPRQLFSAAPRALSVPVDGTTLKFENGVLKAVSADTSAGGEAVINRSRTIAFGAVTCPAGYILSGCWAYKASGEAGSVTTTDISCTANGGATFQVDANCIQIAGTKTGPAAERANEQFSVATGWSTSSASWVNTDAVVEVNSSGRPLLLKFSSQAASACAGGIIGIRFTIDGNAVTTASYGNAMLQTAQNSASHQGMIEANWLAKNVPAGLHKIRVQARVSGPPLNCTGSLNEPENAEETERTLIVLEL